MAIVNVSLDTKSRQAVMTIDGILIPANEFNIGKYIFDGREEIDFSYIREIDVNGMMERRSFYLPSSIDIATNAVKELGDEGLASKIVYDDDKAKVDIINFIKANKK
ncbi:MAG: hypothetical protein JSW11_00285 [Candidatus Heimdallarchaeota archaeon]|nr:MAG: hypothetical protein JSW11_00285 [Candidatus Heimdallarchaeota archaeon]